MGQKVSPTGFRIGITEPWRSRWYAAKRDFGKLMVEDELIRRYIAHAHKDAAIPKVEIERTAEEVTIILHTARPGLIIGRKGAAVDQLRDEIQRMTGKKVNINIREVERPELEANLVASSIAEQLCKRAAFRRAIRRAAETTMQAGAEGIKILIGGRLGGGELARQDKVIMGKLPLGTLDADIDYGFAEAATTYGRIGVKVWVYRGKYPVPEEDA
jgi:small subunit ribosomal protein S3